MKGMEKKTLKVGLRKGNWGKGRGRRVAGCGVGAGAGGRGSRKELGV